MQTNVNGNRKVTEQFEANPTGTTAAWEAIIC
jgi:hypothetical protein